MNKAPVDRHVGLELRPIAPLLPSRLRPLLDHEEAQPMLRGVSVSFLGDLFGAALAVIPLDKKTADLRSLYVRGEMRRKGIAASLIAELEVWLREEGVEKVRWIFENTQPNLSLVHHLLDRQGWEPSRMDGFYVSCSRPPTIERLLSASWVKEPRVPHGIFLGNWDEIPPGEMENLARRTVDDDFDLEVSCVENLNRIDPAISVPALVNNEPEGKRHLAGWMTVGKGVDGWRNYRTLYVEPRFRNTGLGLALLAEAIHRHHRADHGKPKVGGFWFMRDFRKSMQRLFKRRLQPLADFFLERFSREKRLI